MNSFTHSYAQALLNFFFKGNSYGLVMAGGTATWSTNPALYLGLLTSLPNKNGALSEVTGGSYARKAVAVTDWVVASSSNDFDIITLANNLTFVTPTANWGTVVAVGIFDASTGGSLVLGIELNTSLTVTNGNAPIIKSGAAEGITIRLD